MNYNHLWMVIGATALTSLVIMLLAVIYWSFFEPAPLMIKEARVLNENATVSKSAGDELSLEFVAQKSKGCMAFSRYHMEGPKGFLYEAHGLSNFNPAAPGEWRTTRYRVEIPKRMSNGTAYFWETIIYFCNPLRTHVVITPRLPFTVVD